MIWEERDLMELLAYVKGFDCCGRIETMGLIKKITSKEV
jgi:hypothetical protein